MGVREGRDWGQVAVSRSRCAHCVYADAHLALHYGNPNACLGPDPKSVADAIELHFLFS